MKRHLQRFHPKVVNEKDTTTNKTLPITSKLAQNRSTEEKGQSGRGSITRFFTTDKVTVTMTTEKFKKHLICLVVKNGVALTLFSQLAFLGLNGEIAKKLGVSLERQSIRKLILEEAQNEKEELRKTLKGRFMYIKMDGTTRHRVNYFAINARFVDANKKMVTQTLGVKDIKAHHDSTYLQSLVEDILKDFEIKKKQILCIVIDNASNMLSTIEKMNKTEEEKFTTEGDVSDSDSETETAEIEQNYETSDDIAEEASELNKIKHMRCVVHTLQLAIRDGLQLRHAATLISKLRQVVTAARTPKIDAILQRSAGKGTILDQAIRWGSTYMMVKRLLELKPFLDDIDNPSVFLTEN